MIRVIQIDTGLETIKCLPVDIYVPAMHTLISEYSHAGTPKSAR
jgi:hypothetical protein